MYSENEIISQSDFFATPHLDRTRLARKLLHELKQLYDGLNQELQGEIADILRNTYDGDKCRYTNTGEFAYAVASAMES